MYNTVKPLPEQLQWADMELGVIIHLCMDIYNPAFNEIKTEKVREYLPAKNFNPISLDTDQWIKAASDMGAKYAVLVANHCTGFSLWPTKLDNYSVKASPWKEGKGDIVADFIKSCEKFKLKPGLYYSTGCNGYYGINDDHPDYNSQRYKDYVKVVEAQVKELWSEYGDLFEIWFDGGVVPVALGGPLLVPILEKYQPNAICFQGPKEHNKNVRWVGNENGMAPEDCWSTAVVNSVSFDGTGRDELKGKGNPDGKYWIPAETDMANRTQGAFGGGWMWKVGEEDKVYSTDKLMECYYTSVGRNSNLLMGMAINDNGLFEDYKQLEDFGNQIKKIFEKPLAQISGEGYIHTITFENSTKINHVVIRENIENGQHIRKFIVEAETSEGTINLCFGECIGHKRIIKTDNISVKSVTLKILQSVETPLIRDMIVY